MMRSEDDWFNTLLPYKTTNDSISLETTTRGIFTGKVTGLSSSSVYIGGRKVHLGEIVKFASPDAE